MWASGGCSQSWQRRVSAWLNRRTEQPWQVRPELCHGLLLDVKWEMAWRGEEELEVTAWVVHCVLGLTWWPVTLYSLTLLFLDHGLTSFIIDRSQVPSNSIYQYPRNYSLERYKKRERVLKFNGWRFIMMLSWYHLRQKVVGSLCPS